MSDLAMERLAPFSAVFTPRNLAQFLSLNEWALKTKRAWAQVWLAPEQPNGRPLIARVPQEHTDVDYWRALEQALLTIGEAQNLTLGELAEQIAAIHADLVFIRAPRTDADGTIPLRDAVQLIDSVGDMFDSAAIRTANPRSSGRGRKPERVKHFLDSDLRFGHTKRGSFIITVAARLDEPELEIPEVGTAPTQVVQPPVAEAPNGPLPEPRHEEPPAEQMDFSRRVMVTFSRTLSTAWTYLAADSADKVVTLTEAQEAGVNVKTLEALATIAEAQGGGDVELSFDWSPTLAQPNLPEQIVFTPVEIERIPQAVERLKQRENEPAPTHIVGRVTSLALGDIHNPQNTSGVVELRADVAGTPRTVLVELAGRDYRWAIYAFEHSRLLPISGQLSKVSNRWTLEPPITVDSSMLRRHQLARTGNLLDENGEPLEDEDAATDVEP